MTLPRLLENLNEPLGHALFPIFSLLAHNCMSNCRYTVSEDGRFVTVRALRHIKAGEHLNIDYANPLLGHLVMFLLYYFSVLFKFNWSNFRLDERLFSDIGSLIASVRDVLVARKWTPICRLSDVQTETDTFYL